MSLESLLASLQSGVTEVSGVGDEIETVTPETPNGQAGVTAQPAPTGACTPETPVTPQSHEGEAEEGEPVIVSGEWLLHYVDRDPLRRYAINADKLSGAIMSLESLLASLKIGVTEVTGVQASRSKDFAGNPNGFAGVTEVSGVGDEIETVTPETPNGQAGVTAEPAPTGACTPETPVTPQFNEGEAGEGEPVTVSREWLLHYVDRDPLAVACCPAATHAEVLARHPDAVAAEPFTPTLQQTLAPMTPSERVVVRAWLAHIDETDAAIIAEVIDQCQRDLEARDYFTRRAAVELPNSDPFADDRHTCDQCANLIAGRCHAARRREMVVHQNYEPICDLPQRCEGYTPRTEDSDGRSSQEYGGTHPDDF